MDGEKRFLMIAISLGIMCVTILYAFLFIALWAYKELVAASLLGLVVVVVGVYLRGRLNEQNLRQARYRYGEEIPLDLQGEPRYWPTGAQENPYRREVVPVYRYRKGPVLRED
jgi:hypothetical protein